MTEITIPKTEYDSLLATKSKAEWLQEKVTKLEEETSNKSTAIDEARKKLDDYKKDAKKELDTEKDKNQKLLEKLWIKEWEDPLKKIDDLSLNNSKYTEILDKQKQERTDRIEGYKKTLWEEFLKEKSSLLDWLDEDKQEAFLKEYIDLKGLWNKGDNTPKVWVHNWQDWKDPKWASNFDKLVESWASAKDLISSLD